MKTKIITTLFILFALTLGACGAEAEATPSEESQLGGVYTQVALTLSAQPQAATSTPLPSATPTLLKLVTSTGMPTIPPSSNISFSTPVNTGGCDSSAYLSDVTIPDGTVLSPGESFTKSWSLQNTGSCTWSTSYAIAYYSGSAMSGETTSMSESVSPGGSIEISMEMTSPSTAGSYTGYWRLQNASGTSFGEAVYVQIVVSGNSTTTATSTPTATEEESESTSTPTATSEPTSTTAPTSTSAPTNTLEPTATETPSS